MNELSLFSGAGGGLLGTMLLGFRPIGYVEWDDYCQRVLAARIRNGILPDAPIFGDIKTFISDGYAASYTGMVDVITAGFPCQPFSVAGKQKGADDERNMWPATATVIGIVKPRFVLLENVPGVRTYLPVVVRDLRRLGYEVSRPLILGADDVGAPHRRKRVWIVGYSEQNGRIASENRRSIRKEPIQRRSCQPEQEATEQIGEFTGTGSERWATCPCHVAHSPQRQDDGRERGDLVSTPPLTLAVKMWPTPTVNMISGGPNNESPTVKAGRHGINLKGAVHGGRPTLPTPSASMVTMQDMEQAKFAGSANRPKYADCPGGALNPEWVEWLMGWPLGWTDLKPLAMGRFRQWWLQHGGF
jgi:site-specific DNA-cytosine methylase